MAFPDLHFDTDRFAYGFPANRDLPAELIDHIDYSGKIQDKIRKHNEADFVLFMILGVNIEQDLHFASTRGWIGDRINIVLEINNV